MHIHPSRQPPHLFFACDPTDDWHRGNNDQLHEKLDALGVPHVCDLTTRAALRGLISTALTASCVLPPAWKRRAGGCCRVCSRSLWHRGGTFPSNVPRSLTGWIAIPDPADAFNTEKWGNSIRNRSCYAPGYILTKMEGPGKNRTSWSGDSVPGEKWLRTVGSARVYYR